MARKPRLEPAFEEADALIGIASTLPLAQLVYFINRDTHLNLVRESDLQVFSEKTETLEPFRFYYYFDEEYRSEFCLIGNHNEGRFMLPSQRQFGYFLFIYGSCTEQIIISIVKGFKSIPGVQIAAVLPQSPIREMGGVLQDLEIHLTELKTAKDEIPKYIMPLSDDQ
jgi:hypothetical protein